MDDRRQQAEAEAIGARMQRLRDARKLTQPDLATAVGVHYQTVSNWETGRADFRKVSLETAIRVAEALGCSLDQIVQVVGEAPNAALPPVRPGPVYLLDGAKLAALRRAKSLADVDEIAEPVQKRGRAVIVTYTVDPEDIIVTKEQYEAVLAEVDRILASLPAKSVRSG